MEKLKQERIEEIDARIKGLREHAGMWAKAGGRGGMMAMKAYSEIDELKLERYGLINGKDKLEICRIEKELEYLTYLRNDANVFFRFVYNSKIKKLEKKLYELKKKDRKIVISNVSCKSDDVNNSKIETNPDDMKNNSFNDAEFEMYKKGYYDGVTFNQGEKLELDKSYVNDTNFDETASYSIDETVQIEEKGRSR